MLHLFFFDDTTQDLFLKMSNEYYQFLLNKVATTKWYADTFPHFYGKATDPSLPLKERVEAAESIVTLYTVPENLPIEGMPLTRDPGYIIECIKNHPNYYEQFPLYMSFLDMDTKTLEEKAKLLQEVLLLSHYRKGVNKN